VFLVSSALDEAYDRCALAFSVGRGLAGRNGMGLGVGLYFKKALYMNDIPCTCLHATSNEECMQLLAFVDNSPVNVQYNIDAIICSNKTVR